MPASAPAAARKPLKRSHTSPTSQIAAGQRIALPQQAQTPKASAPPANWGQALKGLSAAAEKPTLKRQQSSNSNLTMAMVPPSPARAASEVNLGVDSSAAAVADSDQ